MSLIEDLYIFKDAVFDFLDEKAGLIILVFGSGGELLKANRFAGEQMKEQAGQAFFSDIFLDFKGNLNLEELASDPGREHLLHLDCAPGSPQSFLFHFYRSDGKILAIGRQDLTEVPVLRRQMLEMTSQMSNLNRELQKNNVELARLNDLKNQFVGMAAHDMRNPIGQILICCEFLLDEENQTLGNEEIELLGIIRSTSRFMLGLIDDLLDLTLIEAGKLHLDKELTDLVGLIRRNVELNSMLAAKRNITIQLDGVQLIPRLMIDPAKIEQVLNNLTSNAMKYSPDGGKIRIAYFSTEKDVIISVSDQGPGVPPEEISQIFRPFSRSKVEPAAKEKSTGLGLAISSRIIMGHKGRIWVESNQGKGAAFYFSLPLERPNTAKSPE